ncbi:hypothetical protein [Streptomyces sp. NPDC056891]|uniref:hypothetical protein n=1 Tax=unclassified Streptomyces TaxID=2593676 RepID=UPI0036B83DAE
MPLRDRKDDMLQLPTLLAEARGILVLDDSVSARAHLRTLADFYREDPEFVGDILILIADLGDAAEEAQCSGGCNCTARARDVLVDDLLADMGGARTPLDPRVNHHALMQARRLAGAAQAIADVARARADELATLTAVERQVREEARQSTSS